MEALVTSRLKTDKGKCFKNRPISNFVQVMFLNIQRLLVKSHMVDIMSSDNNLDVIGIG